MTGLPDDLRHAARGLLRRPMFTLAVTAALALGIGASTAIFSVVDALLLRPLPPPAGDRLVMVHQTSPCGARELPTPGDFVDWSERTEVWDAIGALEVPGYTVQLAGRSERTLGGPSSASVLRLLGAHPALGRILTSADERPGAPDVVVLSHAMFERLGGRPDLVGQAIHLDGRPHTVVGVLDRGFRFFLPVDTWTPLRVDGAFRADRTRRDLRVFARLKPGVSLERAQAVLDTVSARAAEEHPETHRGRRALVSSLRAEGEGRISTLLPPGAKIPRVEV